VRVGQAGLVAHGGEGALLLSGDVHRDVVAAAHCHMTC
jgi:hypothetical protein